MKRRLAGLAVLLIVSAWGTGVWATTTPLSGYHGFSVSVANDSSTFYMDFPSATLGANAEWIGSSSVKTNGGSGPFLTTVNDAVDGSPTGYFTVNDTGGSGSGVTDFLLLVSVQGPVASNFDLSLTWTVGGVNKTFSATETNFSYGSNTTRPGGSASVSLYPGQNINDATTAALLMFVDLQGGSPGNPVTVNYSFTGLYGDTAAFNMYGYSPTGGNADAGKAGIDWTNKTANGYVIYDTAKAPVPVPPSLLLLAGGLGGLGAFRKRKTK